MKYTIDLSNEQEQALTDMNVKSNGNDLTSNQDFLNSLVLSELEIHLLETQQEKLEELKNKASKLELEDLDILIGSITKV